MTEHDDSFHGYVRAKLEDILNGQGSQWTAINALKGEMASARVEIGALKATARAWGVFAGSVSGILTALGAKLWRP